MDLLRDVPIPPGSDFRPFAEDRTERSIGRCFERQARVHGDRTAVECDGVRTSYAELNATANRLARTVLARRGAAAEPVALLLDHGGEALAAILAVLKAGKFYVVLDPAYPPDRLEYMLGHCGAELMIADRRNLDRARALAGDRVELVDFGAVDPALSGADLDTAPAPEDLALIIYTSGSTGRPKGVMHSHRNVLVDARNVIDGYRAASGDRWLLYTSLAFANSVRTVYGALLSGGALYPFDVRRHGFGRLAATMAQSEITIVRCLPTFFRSFAATLDEGRSFPAVRVLAVGGEPLLRADLAFFDRHFAPGCVLVHAFGPTECLSTCWALVPHGARLADGKLPIGRSVRDKDVLLLDESRREVGLGEVGEIAVRSRYISPGYWRDPELTRSAFLPDPTGSDARIYLTGDFGRRSPDGTLVHLGRRDFQVKIRGYRVDVTEIENALRTLAGVADAVVVGRDDDRGEARLVAYYVAAGEPRASPATLREALARTFPDHLVPSLFVALDALPRTPNGKTDRLRLPPPPRAHADPAALPASPESTLEAELAAIWAAVLGLEQVRPHDRFIELGGDSLQAAAIAARASRRFGVELSPVTLLGSPTVAEMARRLAELRGADDEGRRQRLTPRRGGAEGA